MKGEPYENSITCSHYDGYIINECIACISGSTSTVTVTVVDGKNTKDTSDNTKYTVTLNKGTKMTDAQISKVKVWASGDTKGRIKVVQEAFNPVVPASIKNKFSKNTTLKLTYKQTKPIVNFVDSRTKKVFETKVGEVGKTIKFPTAPVHKGFEFKSWSGLTENKKLTKATTYKATANYKELKVKFHSLFFSSASLSSSSQSS